MLKGFIESNPEYFQVYSLVGEYFFMQKDYDQALSYFMTALKKQIPFASEKQTIASRMEFCLQKIKTRIE